MRPSFALPSLLLLVFHLTSLRWTAWADSICSNPQRLEDPRIAASSCVSLHSNWSLTCAFSPTPLPYRPSIPSDLISDLHRAAVLSDPYHDVNFLLNSSLWTSPCSYTHSLSINASEWAALSTSQADLWLVFDGIKMGARVYLNDALQLTSLNQHQRHIIRLSDVWRNASGLLHAGDNQVRVELDPTIDVQGLFSQCTGGWDWAPYSNTQQPDGTPTFSSGLWKDVYVAHVPWLAITDVTPLTHYTGDFPTQRLTDRQHAPFLLNVSLHITALQPTKATLFLSSDWGGSLQTAADLPAGRSQHSLLLTVNASQVRLWWPAGLGPSPLYNIRLTVQGAGQSVSTTRRVGFRFFALVTGDDSDAEWRVHNADADGSGLLTMRFRINGQSFFARGANVVPMDELEGRWTADAHRQLVLNAREAGMNMLRLWGGGAFLPSAFYDACDAAGILLYHDLMHRGTLVNDSSVLDAFTYQVRRLSHHPSIVMWSGCNECDPSEGDIAAVLLPAVVREDASRVVWPASPAQGWLSGVNRLSSLPNGQPLVPRTSSDMNSTAVSTSPPSSPIPSPNPTSPQAGLCQFLANHDVDGPAVSVNASSKEQCCALCWSTDWCTGAAFHDDTCWLKQSGFIYERSDSSPFACLLLNSTRKPLLFAIESHGPYQFGTGSTLDSPTNPHIQSSAPNCSSCPACYALLCVVRRCYPQSHQLSTNPTFISCSSFIPSLLCVGWPAVDGSSDLIPPDATLPLSFDSGVALGLSAHSAFVSEFGCVGFSSFESTSATLSRPHWGLHGGAPPDACSGSGFGNNCTGANVLAQRNYPCDNLLRAFFAADAASLDETGPGAFQRQLWQCMMGQALVLKMQVESRRATNVFGLLVWQFNEIWPTGGWGVVEYGSEGQAGQVMGGRWKPAMHWLHSALYTDVLIACGTAAALQPSSPSPTPQGALGCYVKNDGVTPLLGSVVVEAVDVLGAANQTLLTAPLNLTAGPGVIRWLSAGAVDGSRFVLSASVLSSAGELVVSNVDLLVEPWRLQLQGVGLRAEVVDGRSAAGEVGVRVTKSGAGVALWVTLTTLAEGRFSPNVFLMATDTALVSFLPLDGRDVDRPLLQRSLRVEAANEYRRSRAPVLQRG